jgi:endonuclease-8
MTQAGNRHDLDSARRRYRGFVPEGDAVHRAAFRLQPLVGQRITAASPHPRARAERVAERIDGRRLQSVEAVGKNIVLRFDGGIAVRSHLRMTGRWSVRPRGTRAPGTPWLVLTGDTIEAVLWNGPVLELHLRALERVGPDILERPPRIEAMLSRLQRADPTRPLGETLLDQSLVAGIGNMWLAEILWTVRLSPWLRLGAVGEDDRRRALAAAAELMAAALERGRGSRRSAYRRAGLPCPRCGVNIASRGQGDANRIAYWCPSCQPAPVVPGTVVPGTG